MSKATLTKRIEFCASHRYHNPDWDEAKNRLVFGPCNNENSHGHNYLLEVTLRGEIDPVTGMIINLYDLKQILSEVLEEFDHKHLNLDTPYFTKDIPTTENLALVLWKLIAQHPQIPDLEKIRLYEDENLFAEVNTDCFLNTASTDPPKALVTRQYHFSAGYRPSPGQVNGHNYIIEITIHGSIDSQTGQVTNISTLDQLVQDRVLHRFHQKDITHDPAFQDVPVSDGTLACFIWHALTSEIFSGQLAKVTVSETPGTEACFSG